MGGILINASVINYGGLPSGGSGLLAARPAAGVVGRIYIASDSALLYRDTGSAWVTIGGAGGPSGSGAAGQATFWTAASTISGDNAFFWDNTNKRLGLGTTTPGVRLDIHGTGVIQQINGTTTNNAYLDFQNAGSTQWRIGNQYAAAVNRFSIFNAAGTTEVFTILQSGNIGIGTTTPAQKLQILNGSILLSNNWSLLARNFADTLSISLISRTVGDRVSIDPDGYGTNIGGGGTVVLNGTGGNVGIGYTAPASLLSVAGSALINTNTANALYELFVNGNTYTGGLSPTNSTVAVNTAMARTQTGYVCTATLTLTLPSVSGLNNIFYVIANTGATVTVQRAGADTILDKLGVSQTSVVVAAGTRSMFYCGGGSITYQIF
jgi:hypothetical protein